MSGFDSNDPRDEALWRVLGRVRPVEASPYFTRKVLRALETDSAPPLGWWAGFLRVLAPVGACSGLAILALAGMNSSRPESGVAGTEIEFETIQNLDLLVSNYESSLWLDPSSPSR